jgi:Tol biopolymer transport system component
LPVITDHDPRYLYTIVTGAGGGLLLTRLDGSDEVRLGTDVDGVLKHARWSPDGQNVAFVDETQNEIWIAHLNGSPSTKLPGCEDHNCDYPSFSPDGTKVAFSRWTNGAAVGPAAVGVFVLDLATGDVSDVFTLQRPLLADVPMWMPDGENLVIGVDQMNDNADETGAAVAIVPASGGELRYLTEFNMFGYYGIPNPTSGEIVFGTPFVAEGTASDAYAIQPDGTGLRQITHVAVGEQIRGPKWTPDGTMLLANSTTQGHVTIDPITGEIRPIPNPPADTTSPHLRP